tara:strand:- start:110 stop:328 length:219 start_codon:yes stop_codon:yes gene_type:complete
MRLRPFEDDPTQSLEFRIKTVVSTYLENMMIQTMHFKDKEGKRILVPLADVYREIERITNECIKSLDKYGLY